MLTVNKIRQNIRWKKIIQKIVVRHNFEYEIGIVKVLKILQLILVPQQTSESNEGVEININCVKFPLGNKWQQIYNFLKPVF